MFAKKFLSVVGLLFLGSLSSVHAAAVNDLTDCATAMSTNWNGGSPSCEASTIASCCIDGNKLYKINDDNTCGGDETLSEGIYVINKSGTSSGKLTLGSGDYTENLSDILLYICDSNTCTRTYGYIKDETNYYSILLAGNTKLADAAAITTTPASATTCGSDIGKLINPSSGGTIYLCLKNDFSITFPGNSINSANYLMDKVDTMTSDNHNYKTKVVMKTADYAVAFNNLYQCNNDLEECYDSTTGKIMASNDNLCEGTDCASYYKCTNGLCEESIETRVSRNGDDVVTPKCVTEAAATADSPQCSGKLAAGYYYYSDANANIGAEANSLYSCPDESGYCTKVDRPIGYYVNAQTTGATDTYLACSRGGSAGSYTYACATTSNSAGTACSAAGLYDNSGLFLCLGNTAAAGIQLAASSSYLLSIDSAAFLGIDSKTGKYVVINVDASNNITVQQYKGDGRSDDGVRYKYTDNTDNSNKIVKRDEKAAICGANIDKMSEFKRNFAANHGTSDEILKGDYVEYFEAVNRTP